MKRLMVSKRNATLFFGIVVLGVLVVAGMLLLWPKRVVPSAILEKQVSTLYIPQGGNIQIDSKSFTYDKNQQLTTYKSNFESVPLIVSEQPSPDLFADIPDAYQKVVNGLNNYATFDSTNGTVYLTRPPNQDNKQTAVMNAKGTLMFIKAEKDLSDTQWKQLFNNLNIVK